MKGFMNQEKEVSGRLMGEREGDLVTMMNLGEKKGF